MADPILLIVGLGNPGARYADTRHNAGFNFVNEVTADAGMRLAYDAKFDGNVGQAEIDGRGVRLLTPETFMNLSGAAVAAMTRFYKIPMDQTLVVHDDLDLPPGTARLKLGGGHGGHNGLRDLFEKLGTRDFWRLRIGIGHPGSADDVVNYVLKKPSPDDRISIQRAIDDARREIKSIVRGDMEVAMKALHTKSSDPD